MQTRSVCPLGPRPRLVTHTHTQCYPSLCLVLSRLLRAGKLRAGARELQLEHNAQRRGPLVLRDAVHFHQCGRRASAAGTGHRFQGRVAVQN